LVKETFLFSDGSVMNDFDHTGDDIAPGRRRQSPIAVSRPRTVERAGRLDRATMAIAPIVGAILAATAIFDDAWAWRDRVRTGRRPLALSQAAPQPSRS
jgi:hypothetical protein